MKQFIQGNWQQIKTQLRRKYPRLSQLDLNYREGSEKELLNRLQVKLNMGRGQLMQELKQIITHNR